MLSLTLGRLANQNSTLGVFNSQRGTLEGAVNDKKIPMTWDFPEAVPIGRTSGSWSSALENVQAVVKRLASDKIDGSSVSVYRGDASVFSSSVLFDAIITDPPYLDNYGYSDLSDFFYVWMKRSIGRWLSEHFAGELTPKKVEAIADTKRHGGSMAQAVDFYQGRMRLVFERCHELLKPGGDLVCIYAHKTTSGWQSFVDALRFAGFEIREAWPIDTERSGGLKTGTASLASSITLYAKKRDPEIDTGSYEEIVRPELETIVRERVNTLWDQGVSGADLVIACVGAGLRAFTRFARVEYANGEEVPAERFLSEVETVVLEGILSRLSKETGTVGRTSLEGVDSPTRFYTLWRYTYRTAELDAGEAIIFANGTHVELDGPSGLSSGVRALVEKKKGKYRLRDHAERGDDDRLGLPAENGQPAPQVDVLHRTLWLMESRPADLAEFLREAQPNREQLRLVAQALAGPALKGGELPDVSPTGELAALAKLTANWKSVIEDAVMTSWEQTEQRTGQRPLDFGERGSP